MLADNHTQLHTNNTRRIGQIPMRNIWLLMLYASELYRYLGSNKIDVEDNPEQIANLVAEVLCHLVEERLVRNLSHGYSRKEAEVSRVRGRINVLATERHRLLDKGKICCRFDELTIDTPRNRYVLAALERLPKIGIKSSLANRCGSLALKLSSLGVSKVKPSGYSYQTERFGRHDVSDQKMVAAAELAFSLALPTESEGLFHLATPDKEIRWLRKLFEKAVAGFYSVALDKREWVVAPSKQFNWQVSDKSAGIDEILPRMVTDIIIDQRLRNERLIIDTKFNSLTKKGWYRNETLRSGYLYQMYAYLRSQENERNLRSLTSCGMLLHPAVDDEVAEMVKIQGHAIWFCTVNLGDSALSIRKRLLFLIDKAFSCGSSL
ncbi:5-methylcytosine-specific restriction endonuclease system specificity protein McrC [Vibrio parahaemolyticus]|uniref:5-methylcytosine-specific restriction endonuclease system specificity protein McrC n=1 Tax=Vibrio parahaemolyticus TaxID=670 RepID=UPI00111F931F|nr:5-methylcytosine-specific restriction endonuclease system specificity protein McrC [Vibrio parahaemolyticus]ELA9323936.1 5-methylcytosine-specific restriction endonuclease system specificity protein McrC [Vibrio parahaemolyticus]ELB2242950.1 5-methylcytosine-specific restriction endonuclease system specificity protein McrC [Vibrio parahaemolyticus]MDF5472558.1 5-methylcytosine-specific restriction endonuclease system specificity protein McrC [Vibrio parahaemolyticus]MEA5229737.1 5-methylcyto